MSRLLLALWLLQAGPQGTGVVTGIVRSSNGTPSAGVRVYAVTYRDAVEAAKSPPALDSLTVTDSAGRYRLEIPPGRYHIASGSVASPTYYPGTTDIATARVITVATGEVVSGIDFGSFVPANRSPQFGPNVFIYQPAPVGTGGLSGVLRYPDGTPASGVSVAAVPAAVAGSSGGAQVVIAGLGLPSSPVTDNSGAFRIENLRPDTYYIAAGFADAPHFYPGVTDISKAKTVTPNNSRIYALDFTVSRREPGVQVSGRVLTSSGAPAAGAAVQFLNRNSGPIPAASAFGLPFRNPPREAIVGADGAFVFDNISSGSFTVEANYTGIPSQSRSIVVAAQPLNSIEFILPIAPLTGRILMEDGSAVPNSQLFQEAIVTTVNDPNIVSSTIFPITANGTFTRLHEGGEYRFYLRVLPEEFEIKSMRSGNVDLIKETLKITGNAPVEIDIRVAKRTSPASPASVRVAGMSLDSLSGLPSVGRITLCCSSSGTSERFSAPIKEDGSFDFAAIPPGRYTPGIRPPAGATTSMVESRVDVGSRDVIGLVLSTSQQLGQVATRIDIEGNAPLPPNARPSLILTGPMGRPRIVIDNVTAGDYVVSVPAGVKYDVSVETLPAGYALKSVTGEAIPGMAGAANIRPVVIVIERK